MSADAFLDTNVIVYAFASDAAKAEVAERLLDAGAVVSVQVLNELANVGRRKMNLTFPELREALDVVRGLCRVVPVTLDAHELGIEIAARQRLGIFDAVIVASASLAGCHTLYSEDLHNGAKLGKITVRNPFAGSP